MTRKVMVYLYYASKKECREDCDTLGIDRRRERTIRDGYMTLVGVNEDGSGQFGRVVACIKVRQDLVMEHLEKLQHVDDETWS